MPNEYSDFTHPDDPGSSSGFQRPPGDQGEWYMNRSGAPPAETSQWSGAGYDPGTASIIGKPGQYHSGYVSDPGSWGGVAGTVQRDPVTGELYGDARTTGAQMDIDYYNRLSGQAANSRAPTANYGVADIFNKAGGQMRGAQSDAIELARQRALGINSQAEALGRSMTNQAVDAQKSAAVSTRGGALNQASSLASQGGAEAGFRAQRNADVAAMLAREQAQGREQYMQAGLAQRAGDLQSQGLNQQQALAQAELERQQRELNLQGEMGYAGLSSRVGTESAANALRRKGAGMQFGFQNLQANRADRDQTRSAINQGMSMAGSFFGGAGGGFGG